jgi:hypothetical protein
MEKQRVLCKELYFILLFRRLLRDYKNVCPGMSRQQLTRLTDLKDLSFSVVGKSWQCAQREILFP